MNLNIYLPLVSGSGEEPVTPAGIGNIVVATYNIGYEGDQDADYRINAIHDQFATHQVELASIQELRFEGSSQEIDAVEDHFSDWYITRTPHNVFQEYENAIFSTYPFVGGSGVNVEIPDGSNTRTNISILVASPLGNIRVWSIHTRADAGLYGTEITVQGVKDLSDLEPTVPVILMGDFNLTYPNVREVVDDIFPAMQSRKFARIDHIFVYNLEVVSGYAAPRIISGQHDPVFATLTNDI